MRHTAGIEHYPLVSYWDKAYKTSVSSLWAEHYFMPITKSYGSTNIQEHLMADLSLPKRKYVNCKAIPRFICPIGDVMGNRLSYSVKYYNFIFLYKKTLVGFSVFSVIIMNTDYDSSTSYNVIPIIWCKWWTKIWIGGGVRNHIENWMNVSVTHGAFVWHKQVNQRASLCRMCFVFVR